MFLSKPLNASSKAAYLTSYINVIDANQKNYKKFVHKVCNEPMMTDNIVMYFPKNFYLIDAINKKLTAFKSSGLIQFWIRKFANERFFNFKQTKQGRRALSLDHLFGVFNILFIGNVAALTIFLFELFIAKAKVH